MFNFKRLFFKKEKTDQEKSSLTKADEVHQQILMQLPHERYQIFFINENEKFQSIIKKDYIVPLRFKKAFIQANYLNSLLELSNQSYYVYMDSNKRDYAVISREFNAYAEVRLCHRFPRSVKKKYSPVKFVIEIVQLHSLEKGKGKMLLNELIKMANDLQVPLVLYAETQKNIDYFSQFNFYGIDKGCNQETFMIRPMSNPM